MKVRELIDGLEKGSFDERLREIYGEAVPQQRLRLLALAQRFLEDFGDRQDAGVWSAPGRSEIGGNHTDHQLGNVIAAAVSLDTVAVAAPGRGTKVKVHSEGFAPCETDLKRTAPSKAEAGTTAALVHGVCAAFIKRGFDVGGFEMCVTSDVPPGSGLSTSAAFEVLVGNVVNSLFAGGAVDAVDIAKVGQFAENTYFMKPCGLMDQMASSVGGFVAIDFFDPDAPLLHTIHYSLEDNGFALCVVDAGGSHAELTDEYASITDECKAVSRFFGKTHLSRVDEQEFYRRLGELRGKVNDRAIVRAIHFFGENKRAKKEYTALKNNDIGLFLELVTESGYSSYMYLQNVYPSRDPAERSVSLALAVSERYLKGRGAWRVQGGGFAGTIEAFVPLDLRQTYQAAMESIFGAGSCHYLSVRPHGGVRIA
ncbi:MAG: galactokinase family protein [Oscillospiraceae bacterium]|nr:galactokinase family protein [Oscillospiraceae bacterium]